MLLFRSEEHIERWCRQWQRPLGGTLSLARGWHLAQLWYGDRLDPDWRPKTAAEAESVFRQVGLVGKFWKLTG
jgi:hypothetical protein